MKVFCDGLAMWKEWRMIGLLRAYVGECAGSHSAVRLQKRCIDTLKDCLRERSVDDRQRSRMVQDCLRKKGLDVR